MWAIVSWEKTLQSDNQTLFLYRKGFCQVLKTRQKDEPPYDKQVFTSANKRSSIHFWNIVVCGFHILKPLNFDCSLFKADLCVCVHMLSIPCRCEMHVCMCVYSGGGGGNFYSNDHTFNKAFSTWEPCSLKCVSVKIGGGGGGRNACVKEVNSSS